MPPKFQQSTAAERYVAEADIDDVKLELLPEGEVDQAQEEQDEKQEEAEEAKATGKSPPITNKAFKRHIKNLRVESDTKHAQSSDTKHVQSVDFLNKNPSEFIKRLSIKNSKYLNLDYVGLQEIANLLITLERDPLVTIDEESKKFMTSLILKQTFTRIMTTPTFKNATESLIGRSLPGGAARKFTPSGKPVYKSRVEFLQHYLEYIGPAHAASLLREDCNLSFPFNLSTTPISTKPSMKANFAFIEAKTSPLTTILLHKNKQENLNGLFATTSPYINDTDALRIVTTPITKVDSTSAHAKRAVRFLISYGMYTGLEYSADPNRTLPKIVASNHANISSDLVHFLLEKNIPADVLHNIAMDHTFASGTSLYSSRRIMTVLAVNCTEHPEDFTNLYGKIHPLLTDEQKIALYLTDDFGVNLEGKFKRGASFASIAAEQYPEVFKQILKDLTILMESGKIKPANLEKLLESSNKNLVTARGSDEARASSDRATSSDGTSAAASERTPLLQGATTSSTETDDAPQDDLINHRYTAEKVRGLIDRSGTEESRKFKEVHERLKAPAPAARRPAGQQARTSSVCATM